MKTFVIVPAAGQGRRFGGLKQFQNLGGKPLLLHVLEAFQQSPFIQGIHVMVPESELYPTNALTTKAGLSKVKILAGGKERQDSVRLGFETLPPCDIVMVHDGARPFVTQAMIEGSIRSARDGGACVLGIPVKDTIKRVDHEGNIIQTTDRTGLWSIQTPQTFQYEIFAKAVQRAQEDRFLGTDESMLVERIGVHVKVIEGSPYNLKVTTPEDLRMAEAILKMERP